MIQNGTDANAVDEDGKSVLQCAARAALRSRRQGLRARYVDIAKLLIQNGADVNAVDEKK